MFAKQFTHSIWSKTALAVLRATATATATATAKAKAKAKAVALPLYPVTSLDETQCCEDVVAL